MENIKDMAGLARIIERNARNSTLASTVENKAVVDQLRKAGVDYDTIREFAEFLKNGVFAIERVEFIPGWDTSDIAKGIMPSLDGGKAYDPGDFGPSLPEKGSLAAHRTNYTFTPLGNGGFSRGESYSDGSSWTQTETTGGPRNHTSVSVLITNEDGLEYLVSYTVDKNGEFAGPRQETFAGDPEKS